VAPSRNLLGRNLLVLLDEGLRKGRGISLGNGKKGGRAAGQGVGERTSVAGGTPSMGKTT